MKRQRGYALSMVLIFLMLGTLIIIPVLNYTVIGLSSQAAYRDRMERDASDAALLDAIWRILSQGLLQQIDPETGQYVYDFELGLNKWDVTVEIPEVGDSEWQAIRVNMFSKVDVVPVFLDALGEKTFRYIFRLDMPSWDMDNFSFLLPDGLAYDSGSAVHFAPVAQNEVEPNAAVEAENFIFNYNGSSWTSTSNGTTEYLRGVWGSGFSDIFTVGGSGTILHYDGSNWTAMDSGTTMDLRAVWGSSSSDVYVVGVSGTILHYNGSEWTSMESGTTESLRGIWGSGSTDVFVVGDENTILHYNGIDWSPMSSGLIAQDEVDQSQTAYDGTRLIYGDEWRAQLFEAGISGALTSIVVRAAKSGSPTGDLTVELRNATEIYETTPDQSQTDYDGIRLVYGDNWSAQVFRPGLTGHLTDVTLLASKVGSPSGDLIVELRAVEDYSVDEADQSQTSQNYSDKIYGDYWHAQTFTTSDFEVYGEGTTTMPLHKLTLHLAKIGAPNDLTVELWDVVSGEPGSTVIASTTVSSSVIDAEGDYDFIFDTLPMLTEETQYAIVAYTSGGNNSNRYDIYYDNETNSYAGGTRCYNNNHGSGSWDIHSNDDLFFKAYVQLYTVDVPVDTPLATSSLNDITTEDEYEFSFGNPASITAGMDYVFVIYTAGGDASNYYTVAYNSAGGYANGRESSSTDAGSNWTIDDSTDLYFKTDVQHLVGYDTGENIYATASRSDITTEGDYEFDFDIPYSVTETIKYAIIIYSDGGDAGNCYTIGYNSGGGYADGKEYLSSDGGLHWTFDETTDLYFETYVVVPVDLNAVWGVSSDVYVVGDYGAALYYNGSEWSQMTSGTSEDLRGVWCSAVDEVFAAGDSGTIINYNGSAWSSMTSGTTEHLHGIWGDSASDVFAVGNVGTILHYDGSNWSEMTSNTENNLKHIWGTSSSNVVAVGHSSTKYWKIAKPEGWSYMTAGSWVEVTEMPADPSADWYILKTWEADGRQKLTWMPNFGVFSGNKTYIMAFEVTGTLGWGMHYISPMFVTNDGQSIPLEPTAGVASAMYNIILEVGGHTVIAVVAFTADGEVKLISYEVIS